MSSSFHSSYPEFDGEFPKDSNKIALTRDNIQLARSKGVYLKVKFKETKDQKDPHAVIDGKIIEDDSGEKRFTSSYVIAGSRTIFSKDKSKWTGKASPNCHIYVPYLRIAGSREAIENFLSGKPEYESIATPDNVNIGGRNIKTMVYSCFSVDPESNPHVIEGGKTVRDFYEEEFADSQSQKGSNKQKDIFNLHFFKLIDFLIAHKKDSLIENNKTSRNSGSKTGSHLMKMEFSDFVGQLEQDPNKFKNKVYNIHTGKIETQTSRSHNIRVSDNVDSVVYYASFNPTLGNWQDDLERVLNETSAGQADIDNIITEASNLSAKRGRRGSSSTLASPTLRPLRSPSS